MPTISVRISDEEKEKLLLHGNLSEAVRQAIDEFLNEEESREVLRKLAELHKKNPIRVDVEEIVRTVREGRKH
jgi:Arc/MetJ-type ribon-helix-helix transcriptional regulator